MGLRDLRLPSADVTVPGGDTFAVRGLSLQDVSLLARKHGPALTLLFDRYLQQSTDGADLTEMGLTLLNLAPDAAAEVIALAAGDPEALDVVRRLPLPVQVEALEQTIALTFATDQDLKKVIESVIRAMTSTTTLLNSLQKS